MIYSPPAYSRPTYLKPLPMTERNPILAPKWAESSPPATPAQKGKDADVYIPGIRVYCTFSSRGDLDTGEAWG